MRRLCLPPRRTSLVWTLTPLAYPDESSSAGIFADLGLDLDNLVR
jgi:hypothetical protein